MRLAFIGKMFSGKTTSAEYLVNQGYERLAFAAPVKELSSEILTLVESRIGRKSKVFAFPDATEEQVNRYREEIRDFYADPSNKHTPLTLQGKVHISEGPHRVWTFADVEANKGNPAVRKLLQLVGTEIGRQLVGYEDIWVDKLITNAQGKANVVIDDCRFPNEAQALRDNGFTLVRTTRNEDDRVALVKQKYPDNYEEILGHASETSLDDFDADVTIFARNLDELYEQVGRVLGEEGA